MGPWPLGSLASATPTDRCWDPLENASRPHTLGQACKYWNLGTGPGIGSGRLGGVATGLELPPPSRRSFSFPGSFDGASVNRLSPWQAPGLRRHLHDHALPELKQTLFRLCGVELRDAVLSLS